MESVKCLTCGADLKVIRSYSPIHRMELEAVEDCEQCLKSIAESETKNRLSVEVPRMMRESGIHQSKHVLSLTWEGLQIDSGNQRACEYLKKWIHSGDSVYLWGKTGSGKTWMAIAALLDVIRSGCAGLFVGEDKLESDANNFGREGHIKAAMAAPVLVIDDIGSRPMSPRLLTAYRDIFNEREMCSYRTIFTGQYSLLETDKIWRIGENAPREDIASRFVAHIQGRSIEVGSVQSRRIRRG